MAVGRCRDGGDAGGRGQRRRARAAPERWRRVVAGARKKNVGEGRRRKKKVEEIRWRERMGESETTFSDLMLRNLSE